ncbi:MULTISPECIES: transporter substrate-binding domain-containing protein [unclassified Adlercreutzia]|uniref:transporter substrate-binding domain-containing protein n=1 Tax=unclassified Adlercreutzia TaxID=2636013 RepID=UPI0013EAA6BA|nr:MULTISPECIES: transporter substrate-binding domain-containing protein [unclassified Adlercreutzia]
MKKKIVAVAAACALAISAFALAGCSNSGGSSSSSASSSAAESTLDLGEGFKLTVGFDNSYPPYGFIGEQGEYTGLDLDLAAAVAEMNGWEFVAEPIDWDAKDALLEQGNINCIWNGFTMEGREDKYTFSDPYMLNEQVIVVKADSGINNFESLAGKVVITQIDSAALDVLEGDQASLAGTFNRLDTISDYNNAFMQLQAGNVDAVACDLSIAAYQIAANPDAYVQLDEPLSSEHYAVGFSKSADGEQLAKKVNESLAALVASGQAREICEKYAEYGVDYDANWVLK